LDLRRSKRIEPEYLDGFSSACELNFEFHGWARSAHLGSACNPGIQLFGKSRARSAYHEVRFPGEGAHREIELICCTAYVCFSNRPVRVKRFQAIHHNSVDVTRGLVLLYGIGT
jgi:hypothetical protein